MVIELPDGRALLYDVGTNAGYDAGANVVVPYLDQRGIRRIEAVILSHPNLDHFGGLLGVLDRIAVERVIVSPYFLQLSEPGTASAALLKDLRRRVCDRRADRRPLAADGLRPGTAGGALAAAGAA